MTYRNPTLKRVSLRTRRAHQRQLEATATQMNFLLLAVLAQKGGDVTLSAGTIQQTGLNLANLGYSFRENPAVPGEWIVQLMNDNEENTAHVID